MGNKTKLQMRTDLATDLKITIDTELSTAELNRSIERAYSDLSRFLPDEKVYEDSLQFAVADESVTFPEDTDLDGVVADEALTTSTDGDKATIDGQPDVPRPLTITLTDGDDSITGFTTIVDGIDKDDQALQEIFHYSLGDSKTIIGLKYFKAVFSVEFDQTDGNGADDVFDLGWGAYTDVWVYLANSPVRHDSESATDAASVAIVRNTDFYIDYANGRLKAISGGDIAAEETCTFAYTKSQIGIDLSALPDLIRVDRIEYPVGDVPQEFVAFDVFGKWATVSGGIEGQKEMSEDEQYRIYYKAMHQVPGEYSPGTEPVFLTDTVVLAASAYALFIKALQYEHQAVTDIAYVDVALDKVALYLETNEITADADDANARAILEEITAQAAELRTSISSGALGALVNAKVFLAEVDTTDLGQATVGAEGLLETGDGLINAVNVGGQNVAALYADYARARVAIANARIGAALGFIQEGAQRLSNLRSYLEESGAWDRIAEDFIGEAGARMSNVGNYLTIADRFRTEAIERRNEAWAIWRSAPDFIPDISTSPVRQTSR